MSKRLVIFLCLALILLLAPWGIEADATSNDTSDYPARYDLRELGLVTDVKNQGNYGTCWAFCFANVMESNALVRGYGEYDLSEYQIGYMFSHLLPDICPLADGEGIICNYNWYNGGYSAIVSSSLLRGWAIQSEEDYPYSNIEKSLPDEGASIDGQLYVDSCYTVPATDAKAIKELITKNGSLYMNICSGCITNEVYYNPATAAAYLPTGSIDHFVSIVGWDDNYSKDNFVTTPPGDGAWIIKNSWGSEGGEDGFFYLSYYDFAINDNNCATSITVNKQRPYDRIYQYDGGAGLEPVEDVSDVLINFTAQGNESITGVRIKPVGNINWGTYYCSDWAFDSANATVCVYDGSFDDQKAEADPIYTQEYKVKYPDYQTIKFDDKIDLKKNQQYHLVVSFDHPVYYAVDGPNQRLFYGYENVASGSPGETYVKVDGNNGDGMWYDTVDVLDDDSPSSACIKVLVKDRELTDQEIAAIHTHHVILAVILILLAAVVTFCVIVCLSYKRGR